jgi:hypothetical protein
VGTAAGVREDLPHRIGGLRVDSGAGAERPTDPPTVARYLASLTARLTLQRAMPD